MQCKLLSEADYAKIVQRLYKTTEVQFVRAHLTAISAHVEGFLGDHNNLHITVKRGDVTTTETLFLKTKPQNNKLQTDISEGIGAYKKEIFMYDHLIKEFEKYGCPVNFAAECIYTARGEALIMENLSLKGYTLSDRFKGFNMAQTKCALRALAAFHSAGIAYNLKKTTELQRHYSIADEFGDILAETLFVMTTNPSSIVMKLWNGTLKTIRSMINLLPGEETRKEKFTSMVEKFKFGACFTTDAGYLKTCGHGDLWSNNMMFKYENGGPVECRLLDFQSCRFFYPALDVVLLVFANTTPSFRRENLHELYEYYFEQLEGLLRKQGYQLADFMTFGDFLETVKLVLRDAMLQVLCGVLGINLPADMLSSFVQGGNTAKLEEFMFDNADMCANAFKTDDKYRNIIIEAFQEYYDILLSYE